MVRNKTLRFSVIKKRKDILLKGHRTFKGYFRV